jgi:hypothetical protein
MYEDQGVIAVTRTDADLNRLWDEFHAGVNMSSPELRDWLSTTDSGDAYAPNPDVDPRELGERVLSLLVKRKVDLSDADVADMYAATESIRELLANPPADDVGNEVWRHSLMTLGHDPTRADSPRGVDAEAALG